MPKVCMIVWVMKTTGPEEVGDTEEMEIKKNRKKGKKKENERKSRKGRKGTRNYADALRPGKSPTTSTRPNTTSRNANATKNNTTTSNAPYTTGCTSRRR